MTKKILKTYLVMSRYSWIWGLNNDCEVKND